MNIQNLKKLILKKKKTKGKRTYLESIGEENELNKFMDKLKLDNLNDKKIKEN